MTRVSRDTFRNRLRFLLEDGNPSRSERADRVRDIARQRDVTPATVNAWARGDRAPSNNTRDNIRRQALRRGASRAVQTREGGRFGRSITNERAVRAVRAMQRSVDRQRTANIRAARLTGSQARLEAAQADPIVSEEEIQNIGRQYETLEERQRGMEAGQFMTWEGVVIEDWEAWRSAYEQIAG